MRIAIDLPDELLAAARAVAHRQRMSLDDLVLLGMQEWIDRQEAANLVFPTADGHGLRPGVDVRDLTTLAYGG